MTPLTDLFLTSSGRAGRIAFILGGGGLLALWAGFDLLAPLAVRDMIGWLVAAALLYSGACVLSQRLHDRGRSGWWCACRARARHGVPRQGRTNR